MQVRQEVYDTYWYFAAERQTIFFNKLAGKLPYTNDPILSTYKFCNTYRASDRVSQFLIKDVIYKGKWTEKDHLLRIILFRLLNKLETWQELEAKIGEVSTNTFDFQTYAEALTQIKKESGTIYGNAFILCANKAYGYDIKHLNHLKLLENILKPVTSAKLLNSKSLKELVTNLLDLPLIGNFMAYQLAIDLNYSELFDFSENDFTLPGPGAERGINKAFKDLGKYNKETIISYMVENQDKEFERLGIEFKNLFGRKLHAIDCQGLFCEVDKYSRVKFPELASNRKRIKQSYRPSNNEIEIFYPPNWKLAT
jgi:hypothetical protein